MDQTLSPEVTENLIAFNDERSRVYALVSRCFEREMDADLAAQIARAGAFASDDEGLTAAFSALQADVAGVDDAGLEELAVVFDRVFFGMGPRTAQKAFPYESVYTSEKGLMMQDAFAAVKRVYAAASFTKNPEFKEPEDHVAVELAFMARRCEQAAEALRAGDADTAEELLRGQQAFLAEHLLNWFDRFSADMEHAAEGGFYAHLAAFTRAFLSADAAALAEVVA